MGAVHKASGGEVTGVMPARPLHALLSQVLVAYTVELDNGFERRMIQAGYPEAVLSLAVWLSLMRFLTDGVVSVRDLAERALAPVDQVKFKLGCLERWGFITLEADPADERAVPQSVHRLKERLMRDGWGSGRGIRSGFLVRLSQKGERACEIWPSLLSELEERWNTRFGRTIEKLRSALEGVVRQLDRALPLGLPMYWDGGASDPPLQTPRSAGDASLTTLLPVLLAQLLLEFTREFEAECGVPLALCANTLRVLGEAPVPMAELPRLTGASPETSDIGWQLKRYVAVEANPAGKRGKVVRLTLLGLHVQQTYHRLVNEMERRWEARFGKEAIDRIREGLSELFVLRRGDALLLAEGLMPMPGTQRAGEMAPALGRRDIGAAARQRVRDLAAQTERFVRDPANALPHYPMWDMNRGFGP